MAWETRGGSGSYYTRSVRVVGQVRREYVGSGETARLIARDDALARDARGTQRTERRQQRQAEEDAQRLMRWYCRAVENVLRSELRAAGYHQHDRGAWRKKRGTRAMATERQLAAGRELTRRKEERKRAKEDKIQSMVQEQDAASSLAARRTPIPATEEARRTVINAALRGDDSQDTLALDCIRAHPAETVLGWGNPQKPCLDLVYSASGPGHQVVRAMIEDEYRLKQKQIEGENPTALERLLAERITALRFQLTHFERAYECKIAEGGLLLPLSEHHLKRLEQLNKQYLKAIESLAKVRRLQLPAPPVVTVGQVNAIGQVNIGEKQISVVG